ncbi:MAG: Kae1-associated serine/threonine protein kinase [Nitrososphaerota archaeon]|jgi:TP53 regulating kinase-like protein|uniref:KEOPS complex kinase/ATPase Bud32 n=1 Tax=Candidatus Bathycorpusculum sp. TaxID=2994959 RepID=UPI002826437C|nr:Kae1-associated serine/threonine protein kinase [Candidatus Termitimicrobium sp.]MCL2432615.1 Kae1-associated serine/threonine protein kinase [Candidatus Termitimicrobium sp.]MDR0493634.1 Kae1-associated serine/threonine protein kinase [Nitrososphaerota archaeon]
MDTVDKTPHTHLLKKGAEASLFLTQWHGKDAVLKIRLPKSYRPPTLDQQIRRYRTIHEPQLMHHAKTAGVPTPIIYMINVPQSTIIMQHINGQQIKTILNKLDPPPRHVLCQKIGQSIAHLHNHNLIHGDLTTSNMIQTPNGKIYFIDFGLGEKNNELEAQGVDLHLFKRALQSTHFNFWEDCLTNVLCGYTQIRGIELSKKVYEKIHQIERRGRYVEERKP